MLPNCYLMPCPGMPPFGTGWLPARGPLGRIRITALNRLATHLWDHGLPTFNAARAELGLPALAHLSDQHHAAARVLVLTSRAFDFPASVPPNVTQHEDLKIGGIRMAEQPQRPRASVTLIR